MKYLFNPTTDPITVDVDKLGDNPKQYTLQAGSIEEFDDSVADILRDALVDRMLWANYPKDHNREKRVVELLEMIEVKNEHGQD